MSQMPEADLDRLAAALAALLLAWWRRREQEKVTVGEPAVREGVRDDADVTRPTN